MGTTDIPDSNKKYKREEDENKDVQQRTGKSWCKMYDALQLQRQDGW